MCQAINNSETGRDGAWLGQDSTKEAELIEETERVSVCETGRGKRGEREGKRERQEVFTIDHLSDCRGWQSKSKSQKSLGQTIKKGRLGWWGTVCSYHPEIIFPQGNLSSALCVCVYVNKIICIIVCICLFRLCWVFFAAWAFLSLWRVGAGL